MQFRSAILRKAWGAWWHREVIHPRCTISSKPKLLLWNDKAKKNPQNIISSGHLLISFLCTFKWLQRWKSAPLTMRTGRIPHRLFFFQLIQLKLPSLSYQHFGTTFCITLGSLPLPRLISGLYYTVLDILFWRKLHKRRGGGRLLIIHGARFRFVPRCLRNWKFSAVLLCRRAADRLFRLDVQFSNS